MLAALILAAAAVNLWRPAISGSPSGDPDDSVPVLIAGVYLPAFHVVTPENIHVKYFPKSFAPPGSLHAKEELMDQDGRAAYATLVAVPEGEVLTRTLLNRQAGGTGLASLLQPGRVAVSFGIDRARAAGGWLRPGDTIAIFKSLPPDLKGDWATRKRTEKLLDAVKVLAVDKAFLGQPPGPSTKEDAIAALTSEETHEPIVTILASPGEAAALLEAREAGPLNVVLRAPGDDLPWSIKK